MNHYAICTYLVLFELIMEFIVLRRLDFLKVTSVPFCLSEWIGKFQRTQLLIHSVFKLRKKWIPMLWASLIRLNRVPPEDQHNLEKFNTSIESTLIKHFSTPSINISWTYPEHPCLNPTNIYILGSKSQEESHSDHSRI